MIDRGGEGVFKKRNETFRDFLKEAGRVLGSGGKQGLRRRKQGVRIKNPAAFWARGEKLLRDSLLARRHPEGSGSTSTTETRRSTP
jgi:hypothetical protein